MNFLLLLSALLSALTGVSVGVRAPDAPQTMSQAMVAHHVAAAVEPARSARPVQAVAGLAVVAVAFAALPAIVASTPPAWASRRRE